MRGDIEITVNTIIIFYPMFVFEIGGSYSLVKFINWTYESKLIERIPVLSTNFEFVLVKVPKEKQKIKNMP